jgi:pyrimidine operon attenuation protein/uracil phosphoribosyltransferase
MKPSWSESVPGMKEDFELLDARGIENALAKMADTILERHSGGERLLLVGIRTGGVYLAERLQKRLQAKTPQRVFMGVMDITLYRDDPFVGLPRPEVGSTDLPCAIEGIHLILVDDVIYTGRTVRSALMELMDFGRPRCVELAVLVDRGLRELPIQPNYVGIEIQTQPHQNVHVALQELGQKERVAVFSRREGKEDL